MTRARATPMSRCSACSTLFAGSLLRRDATRPHCCSGVARSHPQHATASIPNNNTLPHTPQHLLHPASTSSSSSPSSFVFFLFFPFFFCLQHRSPKHAKHVARANTVGSSTRLQNTASPTAPASCSPTLSVPHPSKSSGKKKYKSDVPSGVPRVAAQACSRTWGAARTPS